MVDNPKKQEGWADRNIEVKKYKASGKYGWLHLIIGQNKITQKKFLRLKRYMNWFSIPNPEYLEYIQGMLKKGAKELSWEYNEQKEVKITEDKFDDTIQTDNVNLNVSDDMIDFIEENPEFTKKVIALNIKSKDKEFLFELQEIIDEAIVKSGDRFKTAFKELVQGLTKEDAKGMNELSDLMKKWNLYQITSITNVLKNRLDTINTFEELISDAKTFEINTDNSIHRILEKNMWLIDENYWIIQSNKSLRTFIGNEILKENKKQSKKRPDFACVNPTDEKLIIVEIKRPALILKKAELDQAELYHRIIKKYKGKNYRSIEIYLIGNKISDEAREIVDLRKGVQIRTYSDFLENCRRRYQEYLKIVEN